MSRIVFCNEPHITCNVKNNYYSKTLKMHNIVIELRTKAGKQVSTGLMEGEGLGWLVVHDDCCCRLHC